MFPGSPARLRPEVPLNSLLPLTRKGFALTVLVFYFSDVMDKLGRSASLIGLGLLFLGGGYLLEQARRRLVAGVRGPVP